MRKGWCCPQDAVVVGVQLAAIQVEALDPPHTISMQFSSPNWRYSISVGNEIETLSVGTKGMGSTAWLPGALL